MAPHRGYETALLLAGVKPMGVFFLSEPNEEIARLRAAVKAGHLIERVVEIGSDGLHAKFHAVFFAQPGLERELQHVAEHHEAFCAGNDPEPLDKDIGLYLGYTENDVRLFERGGLNALPLVPRLLMKATEPWRRRVRNELALAQQGVTP